MTSRSTPFGVRSPHVLDRRGLAFRSFWTDTVVSWLCKAGGAPVGNPPMTDMPRVVLLMHPFAGYDRGLLEGIARYAQLHGPWVFCLAGEHPEVPMLESDSTSDKLFPVGLANSRPAKNRSRCAAWRRRDHRPDSDARDRPDPAVFQAAGDCGGPDGEAACRDRSAIENLGNLRRLAKCGAHRGGASDRARLYFLRFLRIPGATLVGPAVRRFLPSGSRKRALLLAFTSPPGTPAPCRGRANSRW